MVTGVEFVGSIGYLSGEAEGVKKLVGESGVYTIKAFTPVV